MNDDVKLSPATVEGLEGQVAKWLDGANASTAETFVSQGLDEVRRAHTVNGMLLAQGDALAEAERQLRRQFDRDLSATGASIDTALEVTEGRIEQEIRAAEELPPEHATILGDRDRLMVEIFTGVTEDRLRARFAGRTRRQVLEAYRAADGNSHEGRVLQRLIERQVKAGWADLALRDDPDHDATALLELQKVVGERRTARVPAWLHDARTRTQALRRGVRFKTTLEHLRSGRGIATIASVTR